MRWFTYGSAPFFLPRIYALDRWRSAREGLSYSAPTARMILVRMSYVGAKTSLLMLPLFQGVKRSFGLEAFEIPGAAPERDTR